MSNINKSKDLIINSLDFFDKNKENLSLINMGDKIKFNPISKEEFLLQGGII